MIEMKVMSGGHLMLEMNEPQNKDTIVALLIRFQRVACLRLRPWRGHMALIFGLVCPRFALELCAILVHTVLEDGQRQPAFQSMACGLTS